MVGYFTQIPYVQAQKDSVYRVLQNLYKPSKAHIVGSVGNIECLGVGAVAQATGDQMTWKRLRQFN